MKKYKEKVSKLKTEKTTRVTARLQSVDNNQLLTQSSKIDNAFASSAHFSSSVNGARAMLYDFLAKYSPDLYRSRISLMIALSLFYQAQRNAMIQTV